MAQNNEHENSDTYNILVIDDEKRIRDVTHRMLTEEGFEVALAETGEVGMKIIDEKLPDSFIIARTGAEQYAVLSIKCAHRGVEVEYRADKKEFKCASLGGSSYGLDGKNLGGPAEGNGVKAYSASVKENNLIISYG